MHEYCVQLCGVENRGAGIYRVGGIQKSFQDLPKSSFPSQASTFLFTTNKMGSTNFHGTSESFLRWFKSLPDATFSDAIKIVDLRDRNAGRGISRCSYMPAGSS
jgi:hypothetical protein